MQTAKSKTFRMTRSIFFLGLVFSFFGCTKKPDNGSQVVVRLPVANEIQSANSGNSPLSKRDHFAKIAKLEAMSAGDWGFAHPASLAETKCFAVVVEASTTTTTAQSTQQCTVDSAPEKNITIAKFAGLAAAGSEIEINGIEVGPNRKFHLFAFAAESSADCQIATVGSFIRKSSLSGPLHIGSATANIVSGINNVEITGSYSGSTGYDNCEWQTPPPLTGGALAIDSGATYTKNLAVTLTHNLPFVASEVYYTKNSACSNGGTWEPYVATKPGFLLETGDGVKSIYAKFRDSTGSVSSCISSGIILDQTVPTLTLSGANAVSAASVSSFFFGGTCSEEGRQINWSVGAVNGSTTCSAGSFTVVGVDLTAVPDGAKMLNATSTDLAGNIGAAANPFTKDVVSPTVTIAQPMTAESINAEESLTLNVTGTCSDNGLNVQITSGLATSSGTCAGGAYSSNLSLAGEPDGALAVMATITDAVGNSTSQSVTIQKDSIPPTAIITGVPTSIVMDPSVTLTVDPSDVVQYRHAVSTVTQADCMNIGNYGAPVPVATPLVITTSTPALYFVCVIGIDAAGNEQIVTTPTIERLTKGPVVISFDERWSSDSEAIGLRSIYLNISPILSTSVNLDVEVQGTASIGTHYTGFINNRDTFTIPAFTSSHPILVSVIGTSITTLEKRLSVSLKGSATQAGVQIGAIQNHQLWIEDSAIGATPLTSLAVGVAHACGISAAAKLFCWGSDSAGGIGDGGANINQPTAVPVDAAFTYTQVAASNYSTCGIRSDTGLLCWGNNTSGQLGLGDTTQRTVPTLVGTGYLKVAMFQTSTCAIKIDGTLQCWGNQTGGRLGNGAGAGFIPTPQVISIGGMAADVSLGWDHGCAVRVDGQILCWGENAVGQLGDGTATASLFPVLVSIGGPATQISAGQMYSCALRSDSKAFCWGEGTSGKLGNSSPAGSLSPVAAHSAYNFTSIKTSANTTCAIDAADAKLKCWGYGYYGLLGNGVRLTGNYTPITVALPSTTSSFAMQTTNICAVSAGMGFCWGSGKNSIHGNGYAEAVAIDYLTPSMEFASLSLGRGGCGITPLGKLWCWGANDIDSFAATGNVGDGTTYSRDSMVHVDPTTTYLSVSFGTRHTCGITTGNILKCWGSNFDGQLGDGTTISRYTPTIIGAGYISVSVGTQSTCAIDTSNKLFCWGDNSMGQLAQGNFTDSNVPIAVSPGDSFSAVSVGANTACAITLSQNLYCWGRNDLGQVGNGTTVDATTPYYILGAIMKVSVGADATCLVNASTDLKCWGRNGSGEIGQAATVPPNYTIPTQVGTGYVDVKVGKNKKANGPGAHVCGLKSVNSVYCWGGSVFGQNFPAVSSVLTPTLMGVSPYAAVETGELQTCARTLGGLWQCRGSVAESQLPFGFSSSVPQLIPRVRF